MAKREGVEGTSHVGCVLIVHCHTETLLLNEGMHAGVPKPGACCRRCTNSFWRCTAIFFCLPGG